MSQEGGLIWSQDPGLHMETKATFPALKCLSAAYYPMCSLDQCKGMGTLFLSHVHYRSCDEEAGTSSGTTLCIPLALSVSKVHVIITVCACREDLCASDVWKSPWSCGYFGAFIQSWRGGEVRRVKIISDFEENGSKTFSKEKCEFPNVPSIETCFAKEECMKFLHDVVDTLGYMSPYLSLPIFP